MFLCIRYNIQDLANFMGMTRQTVSKHCRNLKEKNKYTVNGEEKEIRILNDLEEDEIYDDIYNRYGAIATRTWGRTTTARSGPTATRRPTPRAGRWRTPGTGTSPRCR